MTLCRRLLVCLAFLFPAFAAHALPVMSFPRWVEVQEGDTGHTDVQVPWTLSEPSEAAVGFTWEAFSQGQSQTPGIDFVAVAPTRVLIPAGQTHGHVTVRILGDTHFDNTYEAIEVRVWELDGARTDRHDPSSSDTRIRVLEDDPHIGVGTVATDDYFQVVINGSGILDLAENDRSLSTEGLYTTRLLEEPRHGTLETRRNLWGRLNAGTYQYTPDRDFSGRDSFRYELCYGVCTEARVLLDVKAYIPVTAIRNDRSGLERVGMDTLPSLSEAYFTPTALVAPDRVLMGLQPDPTPLDPWNADSNLSSITRTLPASAAGETREVRVLVSLREGVNRRFQVFVGVDEDGDSLPSPGEMRCLETSDKPWQPYCETVIKVGSKPRDYWVAAQALNGDFSWVDLDIYEVVMDQPDGSLVVTGPGQASRSAPMHLEVSWRDDSLLPGDRRLGLVRVRSDADTVVGDFIFRVDGSREEMGLPLSAGEPRTFDIAAGESLDRVFIDVPEGASRLDVSSLSAGGMDFHLVRQASVGDPEVSTIAPAPEAGDGVVASAGSGEQRHARVEGAALLSGRWYVVPHNAGQARASVTLAASIQAVAPQVRSGSYFNPARPGAGLMLYPAGTERVGLWYTYEAISLRPTWYYLQAPEPDARGIWRSPIYRQTRYGDVSVPMPVGQATVTPMGPDMFAFTYTLHGQTGSEIYSALGRGCPSLFGEPLDISSHWFNPRRDGTGYSVQLWRDYEFFAIFDYDEQGSPIHLSAERQGFAGESGILSLQRLTGACPSCDYRVPGRQGAGSLHRIVSNGQLERVQVDADFEDSFPFAPVRRTWSVIDRVQTLGGPGSTQGCMP